MKARIHEVEVEVEVVVVVMMFVTMSHVADVEEKHDLVDDGNDGMEWMKRMKAN